MSDCSLGVEGRWLQARHSGSGSVECLKLSTDFESMDEQNDVDAGITMVNDWYFSSNPADYFRGRLQMLVVGASRTDEIRGFLADGVEFAGLRISFSADQNSVNASGSRSDEHDPFIVLDSQHLLHHSCETALRLFFAHGPGVQVPWIEVAAIRSARDFKRLVKSRFLSGTIDRDDLALRCVGRTTCPQGWTEQEWIDCIDTYVEMMIAFARVFIDQAGAYNSIKHGLGTAASEVQMSLAGISSSGPSIAYVEPRVGGPNRQWSVRTDWVDLERSFQLIALGIKVIDSIWKRGRSQWLGDEAAEVFVPRGLSLKGLGGSLRSPISSASWTVLTEVRAESE